MYGIMMDTEKGVSDKIEAGDIVFLSTSEVADLMPPMEKTIQIIEETLIAHSEGKTKLPSKSILSLEDRFKGRLVALPAYVELNNEASCGLKWVSSYAENNTLIQQGIPTCKGGDESTFPVSSDRSLIEYGI